MIFRDIWEEESDDGGGTGGVIIVRFGSSHTICWSTAVWIIIILIIITY